MTENSNEKKQKLIEELGFEPLEVAGYFVCIEIFEQKGEKKTEGGIILTSKSAEEENNEICSGRVWSLGDIAYKAAKYMGKPWCDVGDYVVFGRYEGTKMIYEGKTIRIIADDCILSKIKDHKSIKLGR